MPEIWIKKKENDMAKSKTQIPEEFDSIEEIQEFWGEHSTAEYWDEMEDVEIKLSPQLTSKLELKRLYRILELTPKQIREIEKKAKKENLSSKRLIYRWVLEHIS